MQGVSTRSADFVPLRLLKKDVFSETQLGHAAGDADLRLTRRRLDRLPLWSRGIGRYLARREARALERLADVPGVPRLVAIDRDGLIRSWLEGVPLQQAGRIDRRWARDAHRLLRALHRRGVTHNDLAKPQNWLITPDGRAAVIDMQLASVHHRRGRLFRTARYEDLRHLLKQKQRFGPDLLTPTARRLLARRSWPSRIWRATAKPLYNFITRRVLHWSDNEGAGCDMVARAAALRTALRSRQDVLEAVVVPYAQAGGTGLYAFVETAPGTRATPRVSPAPDIVQRVTDWPRGPDGCIREDVLGLVAENRVEELEAILEDQPELAIAVGPIRDARLNLTDRYRR